MIKTVYKNNKKSCSVFLQKHHTGTPDLIGLNILKNRVLSMISQFGRPCVSEESVEPIGTGICGKSKKDIKTDIFKDEAFKIYCA